MLFYVRKYTILHTALRRLFPKWDPLASVGSVVKAEGCISNGKEMPRNHAGDGESMQQCMFSVCKKTYFAFHTCYGEDLASGSVERGE